MRTGPFPEEWERASHNPEAGLRMNGERQLAMTNSGDTCAYCGYDEEYGEYVCDIDMDEDEYIRFLTDHHSQCPYYRNGDEYLVVRSQM